MSEEDNKITSADQLSRLAVPIKVKEISFALSKGLLGSIPVIGPVAAELMGVAIPNLQVERVNIMLTSLSEKVKDLEEDVLESRLGQDNYIGLMEDGIRRASRAKEEQTLGRIANLIAYGIRKPSEIDIASKCLDALSNLDDFDIQLFYAIYWEHPGPDKFVMAEFTGDDKWPFLDNFINQRWPNLYKERNEEERKNLSNAYTYSFMKLVRLSLVEERFIKVTPFGETVGYFLASDDEKERLSELKKIS